MCARTAHSTAAADNRLGKARQADARNSLLYQRLRPAAQSATFGTPNVEAWDGFGDNLRLSRNGSPRKTIRA